MVITYLFVSVLLAVLYYIIFASFFNTPQEESLIRQNDLMESELEKVSGKLDNLENVIGELKERDRAIYKNIFKADPPDFISGFGTGSFLEHIDTTRDDALVRYTRDRANNLGNSIELVDKRISEIFDDLKSTENLANIPAIFPISSMSVSQTGASIGMKIHPFYKTATFHTGIDLLASIGTDVVATADGVVKDIVKSARQHGNQVIIDHGGGYVTMYGHLGGFMVRKSQKVVRGTVIGRVGNSGMSFAPHLHYEVRYKERFLDPVNFFFLDLTPVEYKELFTISVNTGQSLD